MRRGILAVAVALAVMATATTALAAGLTGAFTTKISGLPVKSLNGTWLFTLSPGGAYVVSVAGKVEVHGTATFKGSTVTLGHESGTLACTGSAATGTYTYALSGSTLRLRKVKDLCTNRAFLLGHTFTQARG